MLAKKGTDPVSWLSGADNELDAESFVLPFFMFLHCSNPFSANPLT